MICVAYGSEIASIMVNTIRVAVVRSELSVLDCEMSVLGGGGGEAIPGSCISPAKVERANIKVKTVAAQSWRRCFIVKFLLQKAISEHGNN